MPVFHTKTIESILEPVAQQVSRLVILHEEAEDGNAMPDLAQPVRVVKLAVDNLVKVGYETINVSEDQILKQDMPPALKRVEDSSLFLLDASELLRADPYSAPARKKLIEGSRGILQGTSSLLLAFDEFEVRKIIRGCKSVLEYLAITEVVDRMEDLVTFVRNLSPVLTKMTKDVDNREKELTHQVHSQMLIRSLEQVKALTPVLISGIKIYITANQSGHGKNEARNNRDYTVRKMSDEIHEIIRVLQLTTYDEDEWDADDLTVMKKAQNSIEGKMKPATDWLKSPSALVGSLGDKALRQIIEDSRKIADRCTKPSDKENILRLASDVESMVNTLAELRQQGKGSSPQAVALAKSIQEKLNVLEHMTAEGILNTERSGIRQPAPTVDGKVEQARQWLANPGIDDKGLGEAAISLVVNEGRKVANCCTGPQRQELLRLCDEAEILTNQLSDLCRKGQGYSPQAKAIARNLSEKLAALKSKIQDALVTQVAEDFNDPLSPLKRLSQAAAAPLDAPRREEEFEAKVMDFTEHANRMADTANSVATAGGCRNKQTVEAILKNSNQIKDLTPQVVNAARVLFSNPGNPAALEHFELLKKQWEDNMERLRMLTDEAVDSAALIKAEEEGILRDSQRVLASIDNRDSNGIYGGAANIAHRAGRVLQVAEMESQNSEDPNFVDRVNQASEVLNSAISPQVSSARNLASNPADVASADSWKKNNQALIDAVAGVRNAVSVEPAANTYEPIPPPPDMSQLQISVPDTYGSGGHPISVNEASLRPVQDNFRQQRAPAGPQAPAPPPPVPPPPVPPPPMDLYGYYNYGQPLPPHFPVTSLHLVLFISFSNCCPPLKDLTECKTEEKHLKCFLTLMLYPTPPMPCQARCSGFG